MISIIAVVLAITAGAQAATVPSFEQSLINIRQEILLKRAQQIKAKSQSLAQQIERMAQEASDMYWESWRLRNRVGSLRNRAQNHAPPNPGMPETDPFLRWDIQQLAYDMRNFARRVQLGGQEVSRLKAQAVKDASLVKPAEHLQERSESLRSSCQWLKDDSFWAMLDFRNAGYYMEALDIQRESASASDYSADLKNQARALNAKVKTGG